MRDLYIEPNHIQVAKKQKLESSRLMELTGSRLLGLHVNACLGLLGDDAKPPLGHFLRSILDDV
jgi:Flp pilus assembly protein TadB